MASCNTASFLYMRKYFMKKIICIVFAALTMIASLSGCGGDSSEAVSNRESMASDVKSKVDNVGDDVREGVTDAVDAVTDNVDRMISDGQVSDGDGVIGNEDEDIDGTEDTTNTDLTEQ